MRKKSTIFFANLICLAINLIERLWKFMKKKVLYNRYYPSFKEFKEAFGNFFQRLPEYYNELASIITDDFQIIGA